MSKIVPYTPKEARDANANQLPDKVIETVNNLLAIQGGSNRIVIYQKDVLKTLLTHYSMEEIRERHFLDIENTYRSRGWEVEYEKPGYNETGEPHWVFSPRD